MNKWKKMKLGEILTESKIESINSNAEKRIRVLLGTRGIIKRPLTKETKGATKYFERKAGQFIYGKQNLHKGAFGIIPKELNNFSSSSDLPAFDIDKVCLPEWLDYFLKQGEYYLSLVDIAKGAATKRIQPKALFEVEIPIPNIRTQEKLIFEFLKKEKRQNDITLQISSQKNLLTQLKQAILQEAIQGKLTEDWHVRHPELVSGTHAASELLKRIKAEKAQLIKDKNPSTTLRTRIKKEKALPAITKEEIPFELPEGWVWCRLGDISTYLNGNGFNSGDFDKNSGVKCIKITNAGVREVIETDDTLPFEFVEKYSTYLVYENDIILALTRPYIAAGLKVSLCPKSYDRSLLNQRVAVIKGFKVQNEFIYTYLQSNFVLEGYKKEFDSTGQQPNLRTEHVTNLLFPLPPLSEQKEIVKKVELLMAHCQTLEQEITKSEANAQMLMQAVLKEAFSEKSL